MPTVDFVYNCLGLPSRTPYWQGYNGCLLDEEGRLIESALHRRGDRVCQTRQEPVSPACVVPGIAYYAGIYQAHFGHFIVESISRLWFYDVVKDSGCLVFYHEKNNGQGAVARWATEILDLLGVERQRLRLIRKPTLFRKMLIPGQMSVPICHPSPQLAAMVATVKRNLDACPVSPDPRRVYVSRSRLDIGSGRFAGEAALEALLQDHGYMVVHPQEHSVREQLALYERAKHLVFAEGSAAHLCILLPRMEAAVTVINRRHRRDFLVSQFRNFDIDCEGIDCVRGVLMQRDTSWPETKGLAILDWRGVLERLSRRGVLSPGADHVHWTRSLAESSESDIAEYLANDPERKVLAPPEVLGYATTRSGQALTGESHGMVNARDVLGKSYDAVMEMLNRAARSRLAWRTVRAIGHHVKRMLNSKVCRG